jgi:excinuclease UvrABC nuclease subunit
MGGVNAVKKATREDLAVLTWLPETVAQAIYDKYHSES